jgi:hypothetical protein
VIAARARGGEQSHHADEGDKYAAEYHDDRGDLIGAGGGSKHAFVRLA